MDGVIEAWALAVGALAQGAGLVALIGDLGLSQGEMPSSALTPGVPS